MILFKIIQSQLTINQSNGEDMIWKKMMKRKSSSIWSCVRKIGGSFQLYNLVMGFYILKSKDKNIMWRISIWFERKEVIRRDWKWQEMHKNEVEFDI